MKTNIRPFLILGLSFCLLLNACNSDAPKEEEKHTMEEDFLKDSKFQPPPPPPPPLDTSSSDTTRPVTKVEKPRAKPAYIRFETPTYRFDTINAGDIVNYEFKFSNTGERPLEILGVKASCGCTTPSWPFLLFAKGETGSIKTRFDSKGKKGKQESTVTVSSNAENSEVKLKLVGFVRELE